MAHCEVTSETLINSTGRVALIGNPNVGKSVLFHRLTGKYVSVSNYPGTTVEITQGVLREMKDVLLMDTPGIVSFLSQGEDEQIAERVLMRGNLNTVLQVGDAKNLRRTLHLTVQLAEMGIPLVLALNMMDEAHKLGLVIKTEILSNALGIPIVPTVATRGQGVNELIQAVNRAVKVDFKIEYSQAIEDSLNEIIPLLPAAPISSRALGVLWLCDDRISETWIEEQTNELVIQNMRVTKQKLASMLGVPPASVIQEYRDRYVDNLVRNSLLESIPSKPSLGLMIGHISTHPIWGIPILGLILYATYWFVGVFGAGTLVGLIEEDFFGGILNPWLIVQAERFIPFPLIIDLFLGDYGIWTMGFTYALALLLPIVFTFFIMFGILEDSGYLPRLAVLTNRLFTMMGLNGQAVLPMVLGLGCVTMATMTTRILNRPRDRFMVTLLLALAIPCSAQLGVVLGMLAGISLGATLIWMGIVVLVLVAVGWLASKLLTGERTPLVVELPPLRLPVLSNVLIKTFARLEWYIKEAVPLFILGTILLFTLDKVQVLPGLIGLLEPMVTGWLGLPAEAATAFLLGLMRRDFAATGLFVMQAQGNLTAVQALVGMITITLFIPCIASIFMIIKERGTKVAVGMTAFIFPFAILVGGLVYRLLVLVGWSG